MEECRFSMAGSAPVKPTGTPSLTEAQLYGRKPCAQCGDPSSGLWCVDCEIGSVGDVRVFYCSPKCQQTNSKSHKQSCKWRHRMGRGVSILQDIWTAFEHRTNCVHESFVKVHGRTVTLALKDMQQFLFEALVGKSVFASFSDRDIPGHLDDNLRRAILFRDSCCEPFTTGLPLLKLLTKDLGHVQQPGVTVKNPATVVNIKGDPAALEGHQLLRITTPSNEAFSLDITGHQFGWDDILVPWDKYLHARASRLEDMRPLEGHQLSWRAVPYSLVPPEHTEPASFKLRTALTAGMTKACEDFLRSQACSYAQLLDSDIDTFAALRAGFVKAAKSSLDFELRRMHEKGIGRLYTKDGAVCVVLDEETAAKCKQLWVSQRELVRIMNSGGQMEQLRANWKLMFG